jgi:succinate dehydrogenase / fumarate reductase cytochrome b subunit
MPEKKAVAFHDRPRSPRISIYRLHPETLASGAHRLSGFVLILFLPVYVWLFQSLIGSPESFQHSLELLRSVWGRLFLWVVGVALIYHLCNGIRFLCLDLGLGESRKMMRLSSQIMLAIAFASALLLGVILW